VRCNTRTPLCLFSPIILSFGYGMYVLELIAILGICTFL